MTFYLAYKSDPGQSIFKHRYFETLGEFIEWVKSTGSKVTLDMEGAEEGILLEICD